MGPATRQRLRRGPVARTRSTPGAQVRRSVPALSALALRRAPAEPPLPTREPAPSPDSANRPATPPGTARRLRPARRESTEGPASADCRRTKQFAHGILIRGEAQCFDVDVPETQSQRVLAHTDLE